MTDAPSPPSKPRRLRRWIVRGLLALLAADLVIMAASTGWLDTLGASARGARLERMRRSPNFRDGRFQNPVPTTVMVPGSTWSVAKSWVKGTERRTPSRGLPAAPVSRASFEAPPADGVRACWLGHSTVLLEIEGVRVLFDPVWAKRSSPSSLAGPKRFQPVPLTLEELPAVDAVVLSHDHFDHLDSRTVRALAGRVPEFFVPLGVGAHLAKWGVAPERLRELDWWEEAPAARGRLKLVATPARHFSGRALLDRDATLWASWVIRGASRRAYFGGDGGWFEGLAEIGRRFGPFDLTLLEIGAYHPNWGFIHLGPENAVRAQQDLGGKLLLPIHWGTFNLGIHPWDEPIEQLLEAASKADVRVVAPRLGQTFVADAPPPVERWWKEVP